ncbi:TPA: hypothetical protein ACH3X1_016301 [Trebouxia sp. C0004]
MTDALAKWAAALKTFDSIKHNFRAPGQVEKALNSIALDERILLFRGSDSDIVERLSPYDQVEGASEKFATDRTAQKVAAFQQSNFRLPPALDELERFILHGLSAKLPVTDSFYNGLVAQNDALKEIIEPLSHSGADILAALIVAALHPEFEGGDEIVIAGKAPGMRSTDFSVHYNTRRAYNLYAGRV